jgi:hypothetical protein
MSTARAYLAGNGTQSLALAVGGNTGTANTGATEEYDGTSWTAGGNLNTARMQLASIGTQSTALAFGGGPPESAATEEYNTSTWTTATSLTTATRLLAGAGTQSAGLAIGGYVGTADTAATEEYTGAGALVTKTITVS